MLDFISLKILQFLEYVMYAKVNLLARHIKLSMDARTLKTVKGQHFTHM